MKTKTLLVSITKLTLTLALGVFQGALAQQAAPTYGGTLTISPYQFGLSALTWDPADWNWKLNVDAGPYMELLIAGDLSKGIRGGGKERFISEAWVPPSVQRGELAESWKLIEKPLSLEFKLRKGVMWQARDGVMKAREFVADDVVYNFNRMRASPKATADYMDFVDRVEAKDKHTVTYFLKRFHAEWDLRIGYGFYTGIMPREVAEAGGSDWRKASGTGPFKITEFVSGSYGTYTRNPGYWDSETIAGKSYKLPFVDTLVLQTIRDQQTRIAAFRTGKIDVLLNASWRDLDLLKPILDKVKYNERPHFGAKFIALRTDQKPFDDIRVRRALNMAIDKQAIVKSFYDGHAALLHLPMSSGWGDYYVPLDQMPAGVKELFEFNPTKAKALLAEAGHPNGFEFKMQIATNIPEDLEAAQLVAAYLSKVGVKVLIEPLEYGAFLSLMTTRKHGPGYWTQVGLSNPIASLDKHFNPTSNWNASRLDDAKFNADFAKILTEPIEGKRIPQIKALTAYMMEQAPYIFIPVPNVITLWWPWVKNYEGEQAVGAQRNAPIWARAWVDAELKKKMGF